MDIRSFWIKSQEGIFSSQLEVNHITFTAQESNIIACYISGKTTKQIALLLFLSPHTIETHTRNIIRKMQVGSRSGIVNFVEKSNAYDDLKKRYLDLLAHFELLDIVARLSIYFQKNPLNIKINLIGEKSGELQKSLKGFLSKLSVNFSISLERLILPEKGNFQSKCSLSFISSPILDELVKQKKSEILLVLNNTNITTQKDFTSCREEMYHVALISILEGFINDKELKKVLNGFLLKRNNNPWNPLKSYQKTANKKLKASKRTFLIKSFFLAISILFGLFFFFNFFLNTSCFISNIYLIPNNKFLERKNDIKEIERIFNKNTQKNQNSLIAIVGLGGSGKTTLARTYVNQNTSSIAWEFNVQSKEDLERSFEFFASAIADADENFRKELERIFNDYRGKTRKEKIVGFVKRYIKNQKDWMFIYDDLNVPIKDIKDYLFLDQKCSGNGKIIITTKNEEIKIFVGQENTYYIPPLSEEEKIKLFETIYLNNQKLENVNKLLKMLPPFPLDISLAAHQSLKDPFFSLFDLEDKNNSLIQKETLSFMGDYTNTRYYLVEKTLKEISRSRREFNSILFTLSLIDFKDIPIPMLEDYYGKTLVSVFLNNLKKHSLITNMSYKNGVLVFSIHESVHALLYSCLYSLLSKENQKSFLKETIKVFQKSLQEGRTYKYEDFIPFLKMVTVHGEKLAARKDLFSKEDIISIQYLLALRYNTIGHFARAQEITLNLLDEFKTFRNDRLYAYTCKNLGWSYLFLGKEAAAKIFLERSLKILQQSNNYPLICNNLFLLGIVYMHMGQYNLGLNYMIKSLKIAENQDSISWIKSGLGDLYNRMERFKEAEKILIEAKNFFLKEKNVYKVAWIDIRLGYTYLFTKKHLEAEKLFRQSYKVYKKNFKHVLGESHIGIGWMQGLMGLNYAFLGKFKKAEKYLKRSLIVCNRVYGNGNVRTAIIMQYMGIMYFLKKDKAQSYVLLKKSLDILRKENHPSIKYSTIYLKKLNPCNNQWPCGAIEKMSIIPLSPMV